MKLLTIVMEIPDDSPNKMGVQYSVLNSHLHFSRKLPELKITAHYICCCGQCKNEEHIDVYQAGQQKVIQ